MKLRNLFVAGIVLGMIGCGGTQDETTTPASDVESPIGIFNAWTGTQVFTSGYENCGSIAWNLRQPMSQFRYSNGGYIMSFDGVDSGIDPSRPEIKIICDRTVALSITGSVLTSTSGSNCSVYAHYIGETTWTRSVMDMALLAGNLQYFLPQSGYPFGFWWFALRMPFTLGEIGSGYGVTACIQGGDNNGLGGYWSTFTW